MSNLTRQTADAVIASYDLSRFERVVDVGGGNGAFVEHLLNAVPGLTAVVFDQPDVAARAERYLASRGLADRAQAIGGDFFDTMPLGADAYILKNVLHDWEDARASALLKSCRRAMRSDSRLLVVEEVYPEHLDASFKTRRALSSDLNMLVCTGGRQRSLDSFRSLYQRAGLRLHGVISTSASATVLDGMPQG
jgi:hypothetical protein